MSFRMKLLFLGMLIGSLSGLGVTSAQQIQVVPIPTPTQSQNWNTQGWNTRSPSVPPYTGVPQTTLPYPQPGTTGQIQSVPPQQGPPSGTVPPQTATGTPPTTTYPTTPGTQYQYPYPQTRPPLPGALPPQPPPTTVPAPGTPGAPYPGTQYPGTPYPGTQYPGTPPPPTTTPGMGMPQTAPGAPTTGTYPGVQGTPYPSTQPPQTQMPGVPSAPYTPPTAQQPFVPPQPGLPTGRSVTPQPMLPVPPPAEPLSPFEEYISGHIPPTISFDIKQFGYDLFHTTQPSTPVSTPTPGPGAAQTGTTVPPTQAQATNVPVSTDYVIGPGDEVRVSLWGSIEGTWVVVVDRDGNITLPKVGVIGVAGLSFQELREVLQQEVSKYYSDFQMNVTMGPLKTITVYLVGNATAPGAYPVSSLSTAINALIAGGGPNKSGSLRTIQVKRDGKTVSQLDLYDFLIRGDKTKDIRLLPEDVILIPPIGPIVGVAGNVDRPAIYEMKDKMKLSEVIKLAGGVTAAAYLQRVQVERVSQKQSKVVLDVNLQKMKGSNDIWIENGDIVKVFPIITTVTNKIVLNGNVKRPGEYEWKPGMRLRDIIPSYDALLPDTLLDHAVVERLVEPDMHQEYLTFSLERMLSSWSDSDNLLLQPYDTITVFNKWQIAARDRVQITGAVNQPGDFEFRPNMKLSDLIKLAGGLKKYAYTRSAELTRVIPTQQGPRTEQICVYPNEALAGDPQYDIPLQEDDYLLIRTVPDWQIPKKVTIAGEVNFPGDYAFTKGDKLSSLIERAGGYTDKAYLRGAVFLRLTVKNIQQIQINELTNRIEREMQATGVADTGSARTSEEAKLADYETKQKVMFIESLRRIEAKGRMVVRLDHPLKLKGTPYDIELEESDALFIPTDPNTIQVVGAVQNNSSFVYEPNKDYSYYIKRSGGYGRTADKGQVYILKVDGSSVKPKGNFYWDSESNEWRSGLSGQVEAGDVVVVPDRLEKPTWLRDTRDFTQILYQLAVGAGVLFRGFN